MKTPPSPSAWPAWQRMGTRRLRGRRGVSSFQTANFSKDSSFKKIKKCRQVASKTKQEKARGRGDCES